MIVSDEPLARTFGKARIDAPLSVETAPWAMEAIIPSATATPQSPERKAPYFSVRISLLLSSRPRLMPHSLAFAPAPPTRTLWARLRSGALHTQNSNILSREYGAQTPLPACLFHLVRAARAATASRGPCRNLRADLRHAHQPQKLPALLDHF